jgi:Tfp pilus assembly pilus retraction ATPase PilT
VNGEAHVHIDSIDTQAGTPLVASAGAPVCRATAGVLADLSFSDLYLEPAGDTWFRRGPRDRERHAVDNGSMESVRELRNLAETHARDRNCRIEFDGLRLRVQRIATVNGDLYVCRQLMRRPIPFAVLGYPPKLTAALLSPSFCDGGLVLFTGKTGDGKTASLASWVSARLATFGGTACTVENPVEIELDGQHAFHDDETSTGSASGSATVGTCYQKEVQTDAEFGPAIEDLLRAAPNMIMLGEVRNGGAAAQAVLAGTSGHLVGVTQHANDVPAALGRISNMIRAAGLDAGLLADALCAVVHQSLRTVPDGDTYRTVLTVSPFIVTGATGEVAIRSHLRRGDFSLLASELERQRRMMSQLGSQSTGGVL